MPNRWPTPIEIVAYLIAHVAGIAWGTLVTPFIVQFLVGAGQKPGLLMSAVFLGHSVLVMLAVMALFFTLRAAMQSR